MSVAISFVLCTIIYVVGMLCYRVMFHPLKSYPGPLLWRMSRMPWNYHMYIGDYDKTIVKLHQIYGPVIRIAPDELTYITSQALKEILGRSIAKGEFPKDPYSQQKTPGGLPTIFGADKEHHARYRRLLARAFSDKSLREQESHIQHHVDLMIDRVRECADIGTSTDFVAWYNMTTFDMIGDLAFGESFGSLENRKLHDWIPAVSGNIKWILTGNLVRRYGLDFVLPWFLSKDILALRKKNIDYTTSKVERRIALTTGRGDFWDHIMIKESDENSDGEGITKSEMLNNAGALVAAGSETSATALSGLCSNYS